MAAAAAPARAGVAVNDSDSRLLKRWNELWQLLTQRAFTSAALSSCSFAWHVWHVARMSPCEAKAAAAVLVAPIANVVALRKLRTSKISELLNDRRISIFDGPREEQEHTGDGCLCKR